MKSATRLTLDLIREILDERGLSMKDLAKQLGVSQSSVSRSLSGEVALTIERLQGITAVLGISISSIIEEVERRAEPRTLPPALEEYFCSDLQRYYIFVALNYFSTVEQVMERTGAAAVTVNAVIKRLKAENLILAYPNGTSRLNERARNSKFRNSASFYELKAKLYAAQSQHSFRNLEKPSEYWSTRDDRLIVANLTHEQARVVSEKISVLAREVTEFDRQNDRHGVRGEMYQVFQTLKALTDR